MISVLRKLQSLKRAILLLSNIFLVGLLFFSGCDRDTPVEPVDDGRTPAKPIGLSIFREYDGEIGIEWNSNLEKDISHYKIFRSDSSNNNYQLIDSTQSSYYLDTGLSYLTTYFYRIAAVDNYGNTSEQSDSVSGMPQNLYAPFPPYYLTINAKNWDDSLSVKITFGESFSSDVSFYEIYRSENTAFTPDSSNLIGTSDKLNFIDKNNLEMLKEYFYKIVAVDKGRIKSQPSVEVTDIILDSPKPIYPINESQVNYFADFQIETCSIPTDYKIVLQSNEVYGTEVELNFSSQKTNSIISVPIKNVTFDAYADYYWRVFAYTKNNNIPNSYSELYKFTIVPEN